MDGDSADFDRMLTKLVELEDEVTMENEMKNEHKTVVLSVISNLMEILQITKGEAIDMLIQVNHRAIMKVHEKLDKLHASSEVMLELQHELEEEKHNAEVDKVDGR